MRTKLTNSNLATTQQNEVTVLFENEILFFKL